MKVSPAKSRSGSTRRACEVDRQRGVLAALLPAAGTCPRLVASSLPAFHDQPRPSQPAVQEAERPRRLLVGALWRRLSGGVSARWEKRRLVVGRHAAGFWEDVLAPPAGWPASSPTSPAQSDRQAGLMLYHVPQKGGNAGARRCLETLAKRKTVKRDPVRGLWCSSRTKLSIRGACPNGPISRVAPAAQRPPVCLPSPRSTVRSPPRSWAHRPIGGPKRAADFVSPYGWR